jgi:murein DD-endopeptidase MepM/ murein hydrolase activator NlpD
MSLLGNRRRKKSRAFEVLVIPHGDGGGTKSFRGSKLALWGGGLLAVVFLIFFLAFRYTQLGRLVGVKQEAVDSSAVLTERRIRVLADEMAVLKEYNVTLRKALGERDKTDRPQSSTEQRNEPPALSEQSQQPTTTSAPEEFASTTPATTSIVKGSSLGVVEQGLTASFPLFAPVNGVVTQGFEPENQHYGIDYAAKEGTPVHSASLGYVVFAGWTYDYGNTMILSHGSGYITVYKHCSALLKSTGALVKRGELIGLVGNTGQTSKGPHLHFEVLKDGIPLDPMQLLLRSAMAL